MYRLFFFVSTPFSTVKIFAFSFFFLKISIIVILISEGLYHCHLGFFDRCIFLKLIIIVIVLKYSKDFTEKALFLVTILIYILHIHLCVTVYRYHYILPRRFIHCSLEANDGHQDLLLIYFKKKHITLY